MKFQNAGYPIKLANQTIIKRNEGKEEFSIPNGYLTNGKW